MKKSGSRLYFDTIQTGLKYKRSQVTIFIIIGILLIISIGAVFYFSSISKKNITEDIITLSSSEIASQIKTQRDNCLNEKTIFAIDAYGFDETQIQSFLSQNLAACIQPVINKYKSVAEITPSSLSVNVKINDEKIEITGDYPISVKKIDTQTLDEFSLTLSRTISTNIVTSPFCQTTTDYYLKSWDDKFEIFIYAGTKAQYKNGTCLDKIEIRIEDPIRTHNNRATSLTSLVYIPRPLGAEFSVNNVWLKQKYTAKDYADYYTSLSDIVKPVMGEDKLKIWYYDKSSNNFFVYPSPNLVNITGKEINAYVNIFYDGFLHHSSPEISKTTIIESSDRRMNVLIPENTIITRDGNNVDKISIEIKPKTSNVVNFGFSDYDFSPNGAVMEPNIKVSYKYTQEEADKPEFRYGGYNWQNLINGTWQDPRNTSPIHVDLKTRGEKDLRMAWYDEGVYRPWPTYVDEKNKIVTGLVEHFTPLITAKGCNDFGYGKFIEVNKIELSGDNCTGESKASVPVTYSIKNDNSCATKEDSIMILSKPSDGDTGTLEWTDKQATVGQHTFGVALVDSNKVLSNREGLCAWADAYMRVKGIGVETTWEDISSDMNETIWMNETGLAEWDIALCASYPEEKQEACAVCAGFAENCVRDGCEGRLNKAGDTMQSLSFCTDTMYAEQCSWNAAECNGFTDYCKNAACNKCMEWCTEMPEGFGGSGTTQGSLEHCADVIEHECCAPGQNCGTTPGPNGTYTPGNCQEMGGTYNRNTEQFLGYGLVRYWLDLNNAEVVAFANALAVNNLTATYIEYFGMDVHVGRYDIINHPENVYAKAKFFVETMRARNITTFINYINWNAPDICSNQPFSDTWFTNGLGGLIQQIGTDKVILQTALEGGERCTDKFTRWNNWMAGGWTGMKSYSISGGVKTAPSVEWFINPTPGPSGAFAIGAIVTTDDGNTLRYFADRDGQGNADPAKLENYAGGINIPCHSGFIYYDFGYDGKKPDTGAIQALGRVAANKPKPISQTAPNITLTSPKEGQVYKTLSIPLDGTVDQDITKAGYILNGGSLILFTLPHNITAKEGENKLEVYAQNSAGLIGNVNVTFKVNTSTEGLIPPIITIISPKSEDYEININSKKVLLNVTSDKTITNWKYSLNGGGSNNSFTNPQQITVGEGENNLIVYGTNTEGTGSTSLSFNVRLVNPAYFPKITIEHPVQGFTYTSNPIFIKTISNQTINSWSYSLNGGENKACSFCDSGDFIEAPDGRNSLIIYGTNANGTGSSSTYFFVNTASA